MRVNIFGGERRLRTPKELWTLAKDNGIVDKAEDFLIAMMGALVLALSALVLYICLAVMFL